MLKEYLNRKCVESIIYDTEIEIKKKSTQKKLNIEFLKKLNTYLKQKETSETIDENVKERIIEIINYMRFDMKKNQEPKYNKELNDIIRDINNINDNYCLNFYYNELNARAHNSDEFLYVEKIHQIYRYYNTICYSISYDYKVLTDIIKPPEEYKKVNPKYKGDPWFLSSINGMYYEKPEIFKEDIIIENTLKTIEQNEKLVTFDSEIKKHNQKIKQIVLKR